MALSSKARKALDIAMASPELKTGSTATSPSVSKELADAVDALHAVAPAAHVASNSPAAADTIALSTSDTYTDAAVNTAVNAALATAIADINATRSQINAILAALQAAGLMS